MTQEIFQPRTTDRSTAFQYLRRAALNAHRRAFAAKPLVQAGRTPCEFVYQDDLARLRYYPPLKDDVIDVAGIPMAVERGARPVPLVLVAPLAANMFIYDLFPERSLVKYLRARGFELYLVDWGRPGWQHNHLDLASYFDRRLTDMLAQVRRHSGRQTLSLHGWSLGGVFSLCHAALGDPAIANLVLVGTPCDYHANGRLGLIYQSLARSLDWLEQRAGWRLHDTRRRWWRSPGWANALAFKLTNPVATLQGYVDLARNLHRDDYIRAHATNGAFLNGMEAYPGGVIQDTLQYLLADNVLKTGRLPMREPHAGLSDVTSDLLLVCGRNDPIVTHDCSVAMLPLVGSADQTVLDVPGGHMGILSGSAAPHEIWPRVADWLADRSGTPV